MAKKRRWKKFTTQEKVNYHKSRINDPSLSENQRFYSRSWLDGFLDDHADMNYHAAKDEYSSRKSRGKLSKSQHIIYQSYIRGTAERNKAKGSFRIADYTDLKEELKKGMPGTIK